VLNQEPFVFAARRRRLSPLLEQEGAEVFGGDAVLRIAGVAQFLRHRRGVGVALERNQRLEQPEPRGFRVRSVVIGDGLHQLGCFRVIPAPVEVFAEQEPPFLFLGRGFGLVDQVAEHGFGDVEHSGVGSGDRRLPCRDQAAGGRNPVVAGDFRIEVDRLLAVAGTGEQPRAAHQ